MSRNGRTVAGLLAVIVLMGAGAWAAVPFYSWFCRTTGFGGTTQVATAASDTVLEETVTVRFVASVGNRMPWRFAPMQTEMTLRIGETGLAFFEAENLSDRPIAGTATYNVTPDQAGGFFDKIDCFCFTEQVLAPGERVEMPVSFYVDPAIVGDRDAGHIRNITLAYTFFETDLPEAQAALPPPARTIN